MVMNQDGVQIEERTGKKGCVRSYSKLKCIMIKPRCLLKNGGCSARAKHLNFGGFCESGCEKFGVKKSSVLSFFCEKLR